jgi:hypothetical protein
VRKMASGPTRASWLHGHRQSGWSWAVLVKPAYRRLFARSDRLPLGETFNTVALAVLVARTLTSSQWPSVPGRGL